MMTPAYGDSLHREYSRLITRRIQEKERQNRPYCATSHGEHASDMQLILGTFTLWDASRAS